MDTTQRPTTPVDTTITAIDFKPVPASCPATRPQSPLGVQFDAAKLPVKAVSAPASRRGSFVRTPHRTKNLPPIPRASGDVLLRRTFSATIGGAPTGRGALTNSTAPSPASYAVKDATVESRHRAAPSATFGTASSGRGLTPRAAPRKLPALPGHIGREAAEAQMPHSYHATFGTPHTEIWQRPSCNVHSYLDHERAQPFKHTPSATIGLGKTLPPSSSGCKVHSYLDDTTTQPKKHAFHATFGTERRFGESCGVAHLWAPQPLGLPMQPAPVAAL